MRLTYHPKGSQEGRYRQMGPRPHLIRLTMKAFEDEMEAEMVTENVVNGKLLELKGQALQRGLTSTMRINMTFQEYQERVKEDISTKTPKTKGTPGKGYATSSDATASATPPVMEPKAKPLVSPSKTPKKKAKEVYEVSSGDEVEWLKPDEKKDEVKKES